MNAVEAPPTLVLRFGGRLVEQLGAQLYPRVTASVAELVSNAWDADARNVWITIPFDADWKREAAIEVLDDGSGMTRDQARTHYLIVGRNRRLDSGDTSPGGRPLHGRKGIGKLAAFGTAGYLECVTMRDGETTAFGIDYDKLREYPPDKDYPVETLADFEPLIDPASGKPLEHGTRVRLTRLKAKRKTGEDSFRRSMERRFSLDANKMSVFINGDVLKRYDVPVEIRFPRDAKPPRGEVSIGDDGWAHDVIPYPTKDAPDATREVRWWIGFTKTPIADEDMRGVSVLSRGKLAQRPFMFERALGTTGQLGQEYLVGEVAADWLDHGTLADEDLIQSNRDQLQLDNEELEPFMKWGRELLTWALAQRNRVRRDRNVGPGALGPQVETALEAAPASSRERLRTLAGRIADITQADQAAVAQAVRAVVDATDVKSAERVVADLSLEGDPDDDVTWTLLSEARETMRAGVRTLYVARRDALANFLVAVSEPPVERLHREVASAPWLISPLLAEVPLEVLRLDDQIACVRFEPLPPVLSSLTILCWAVGEDGPSGSPDGLAPDLQIASSWPKPSPGRLTWEQALRHSAEAHDALISSLEEQS
jgi:Histidine kinase-, DNA gyrase B-, and HSP90-like ATPase